jgi:hypothetical protein
MKTRRERTNPRNAALVFTRDLVKRPGICRNFPDDPGCALRSELTCDSTPSGAAALVCSNVAAPRGLELIDIALPCLDLVSCERPIVSVHRELVRVNPNAQLLTDETRLYADRQQEHRILLR